MKCPTKSALRSAAWPIGQSVTTLSYRSYTRCPIGVLVIPPSYKSAPRVSYRTLPDMSIGNLVCCPIGHLTVCAMPQFKVSNRTTGSQEGVLKFRTLNSVSGSSVL